jgi:nucleolar GTP-binding protein
MSCFSEEGVMNARNTACDQLLAARVESKMRGNKINDILHRIHVAQPEARDEQARPAFIPEAVRKRMEAHQQQQAGMDVDDESAPAALALLPKRRLERDIEAENGGAGVYNVDLKKNYLLADDSWKHDIIPEIMDGHNVADFIDPEIAASLDALEREEEELVSKGVYKSDDEEVDEDSMRLRKLANKIIEKKRLIVQAHRMAKTKQGPKLPQKFKNQSEPTKLSAAAAKLSSIGMDTSAFEERAAEMAERTGRKRARSTVGEEVLMAGTTASQAPSKSQLRAKTSKSKLRAGSILASATPATGLNAVASTSMARSASRMRDRSTAGLGTIKQKMQSENMRNKSQRPANQHARKGEADRAVLVKMPKHLFSGKRGIGSSDRR